MAEAPHDAGEDLTAVTMLSQRRVKEEGTSLSLKCIKDKKVPIGVTLVVAVLLLAVIALAAKKCPSCPSCPSPVPSSCLENGIGYGEKCFYFVENEADWNSSEISCLALGAHLATIDTGKELDFFLRYGRSMHYWVGLHRDGFGPWKWLNGSLYNNSFEVRGKGQCAYVNHDGISSDWCSQMKYSICSHLQKRPGRSQKDSEFLSFTCKGVLQMWECSSPLRIAAQASASLGPITGDLEHEIFHLHPTLAPLPGLVAPFRGVNQNWVSPRQEAPCEPVEVPGGFEELEGDRSMAKTLEWEDPPRGWVSIAVWVVLVLLVALTAIKTFFPPEVLQRFPTSGRLRPDSPHDTSETRQARPRWRRNPPKMKETRDFSRFSSAERSTGAGHNLEMKAEARVAFQVTMAVLFMALLVTAVTFAAQAFHPWSPPCFRCPFDWIGYRGKCYYFSEIEGNWTSGQNNCSALGASLAMLDGVEELSFVVRYKGTSEHWIGLSRGDGEQPWKWVNNSRFSHLFRFLTTNPAKIEIVQHQYWHIDTHEFFSFFLFAPSKVGSLISPSRFRIGGGGLCAYVTGDGLSSSRCSARRSWVCSKAELQNPRQNRTKRAQNLCVSS
ncbi:uncharacterized protein LOC134507791 [Chroicocephalus ridibundus]|uniref:uncharacterized protein LOC134507791 n=1 Tax=Chroicocephalus ridibundus TaxID=1192867 RepID=UPI002FDCE494